MFETAARRLADVEAEAAALQSKASELEETRRRLADAEQRVRELAEDVTTLQFLAEERQRAFEGVVNSFSWNVTTPLRAGMSAVRRARGA